VTDPDIRNPEAWRRQLMAASPSQKETLFDPGKLRKVYYYPPGAKKASVWEYTKPVDPYVAEASLGQGCGPALDAAMNDSLEHRENERDEAILRPRLTINRTIGTPLYCRCGECERMRRSAGLIDGVALRGRLEGLLGPPHKRHFYAKGDWERGRAYGLLEAVGLVDETLEGE
jgi:hypothetical protein